MSDVFVSTASGDQATAFRLVQALEKRDLTCWIAAREIPAGFNYQSAIPDAIAACTIFLVLHSRQASARPDEIAKEMSLARRLNKPFIPLRLDDIKPEGVFLYEIATAQYLDMFPDFDASVHRLCLQLASLTARRKEIEARSRTLAKLRTVRTWSLRAALVVMACFGAAFAWKGAALLHAFAHPEDRREALRTETIGPEAILPDIAVSQTTLHAPEQAPPPAPAPLQPRGAEARARDIAMRYYAMSGAPVGPWLGFLDAALADPVRFYGKPVPKAHLIAEQRDYVARWPARSFQVRTGSLAVDCHGGETNCTVTGIEDYNVRSDARGQNAFGSERFFLEMSSVTGGPMRLTTINANPIERHTQMLGAAVSH